MLQNAASPFFTNRLPHPDGVPALLTKLGRRDIIVKNLYKAECRALRDAENRESGANPERYRHCMRGGRAQGASPAIGETREGVRGLGMRKSGDLLSWISSGLSCTRAFGQDWTADKRPQRSSRPLRLFFFSGRERP